MIRVSYQWIILLVEAMAMVIVNGDQWYNDDNVMMLMIMLMLMLMLISLATLISLTTKINNSKHQRID